MNLPRKIRFLFHSAAAILLLSIACGDDDVVQPTPFNGKSMAITVSAADWRYFSSYDIDFNETFHYGIVDSLSGPQLSELSAGDLVRVTVTFPDPLVTQVGLDGQLNFFVRIGPTVSYSGVTAVDASTFTVQSWSNIVTRNVYVYNTSAPGTIAFINLVFTMRPITKGETLRELVVEFTVPDELNGSPLLPNQTLPFRGVDWTVTVTGNISTDPPPILPE